MGKIGANRWADKPLDCPSSSNHWTVSAPGPGRPDRKSGSPPPPPPPSSKICGLSGRRGEWPLGVEGREGNGSAPSKEDGKMSIRFLPLMCELWVQVLKLALSAGGPPFPPPPTPWRWRFRIFPGRSSAQIGGTRQRLWTGQGKPELGQAGAIAN